VGRSSIVYQGGRFLLLSGMTYTERYRQILEARYQQRIAREGLIAALAPYRVERSIPRQIPRSADA